MRKLLDDGERSELVLHLAYHPSAGVVIPGTGGLRKLRWGLEGRGKRSGARVIYFFHDLEMPIFLLYGFAKNEREDLSINQYRDMQQITSAILESYKRRWSK